MSGPVAGLFGTLLNEMSCRNEFSVFIDDARRRRILRGLFENFYADRDAEVIFDTNRGWCSRMTALSALFPEAKVIACVRHMPRVIDSIERLVRRNAFQPSSMFNYQAGGTVYSRVDGVAGSDGMVGFAYNALKEAYFSDEAPGRLLLLCYETLVREPARALAAVYEFVGEPAFDHDFEHIYFNARDFDNRAGTPGLHTVKPRIEASEHPTILPPDILGRFQNDSFWLDPKWLRQGVPVI